MTQVRDLVARVDRYVKRSGKAASTVSRLVFNDGKRLEALRKGKSRVWPESLEKYEREIAKLEKEELERAS